MKKFIKTLIAVFMLSIPTVSSADTCQAGNCVDGQGTLVTNEGYVLEGLFINSQIVSGTLTLTNGMKYEGKIYIDGFPVEGTITIPGGNKYTGEIAHLVPNGQGTMTYSDGDMESYTGSWKAGKQSGQGTMTYSDGTTYKGGWKDGVRHGKGIEVEANGKGKTKVVYKNGDRLK